MALNRRGALINKNTFDRWGGGGIIGRKALNRIIMVIIFNLDNVNLIRHHIWVSSSATEWQAFEGWLLAYM